MRRRLVRAMPGVLLALGAWQVAGGAWIHAKAALAQQLLEHAWQQTRVGGTSVRPWPWADTWPVARLSIPRLGDSWIVLAGASGRTLAFAPGHVQGSAPPGQEGTAIVSGHRDTHFRALRHVRRRDELWIDRPDGVRVRYEVEAMEVVDARSSEVRMLPSGRALVLVTCWPFEAATPGGPLRYVVTARGSEGTQGAGHPLPAPRARAARRAGGRRGRPACDSSRPRFVRLLRESCCRKMATGLCVSSSKPRSRA